MVDEQGLGPGGVGETELAVDRFEQSLLLLGGQLALGRGRRLEAVLTDLDHTPSGGGIDGTDIHRAVIALQHCDQRALNPLTRDAVDR